MNDTSIKPQRTLGNQLLIALQAPDARFVAGFDAWKTLGRRVRKGERGIRILAPMPLRARDSEDRPDVDGDENSSVRTLFKSVAVFDVAQTEPLPGREPVALEPPAEPITGNSHAHLIAPLEQLAHELGFDVEQRRLDGTAEGWCDPQAKRIVVNAALPVNARVRVLVHELAHALGIGIGYADRGRARAEVMVDCVTYVVLGSVGLDVSGETIPYVAGWGRGRRPRCHPRRRADHRRGRASHRKRARGRRAGRGRLTATRHERPWWVGCGHREAGSTTVDSAPESM
jgi:hypothetical protein